MDSGTIPHFWGRYTDIKIREGAEPESYFTIKVMSQRQGSVLVVKRDGTVGRQLELGRAAQVPPEDKFLRGVKTRNGGVFNCVYAVPEDYFFGFLAVMGPLERAGIASVSLMLLQENDVMEFRRRKDLSPITVPRECEQSPDRSGHLLMDACHTGQLFIPMDPSASGPPILEAPFLIQTIRPMRTPILLVSGDGPVGARLGLSGAADRKMGKILHKVFLAGTTLPRIGTYVFLADDWDKFHEFLAPLAMTGFIAHNLMIIEEKNVVMFQETDSSTPVDIFPARVPPHS